MSTSALEGMTDWLIVTNLIKYVSEKDSENNQFMFIIN